MEPAEAAVRWRISAAVIDNIIVYGAYLGLCAALHWRVVAPDHLLLLVLATFAYHFVLEARDGQTIGKRQYGLRVEALDGGRASARAIAIRSALRIFDQLPVWYVSGLISMLRTGPARRQRIGDVAAETRVVAIEGRSLARGTPGWMLPAATILAFALSVLTIYRLAEAGKQPLSSAQQAAFVSTCQNSPAGAVIDCRCVLSQLEADGYVTADSIRNLVAQADSERLSGQVGTATSMMSSIAAGCRR